MIAVFHEITNDLTIPKFIRMYTHTRFIKCIFIVLRWPTGSEEVCVISSTDTTPTSAPTTSPSSWAEMEQVGSVTDDDDDDDDYHLTARCQVSSPRLAVR